MSIKDILDKETDTRDYLHTLSIANDRENKKFSEDLKCSIHGDPNDKLLHIASANGHTEIAKILLDKGGDIDIKGGLGRTPLMYASRGGHCGLVEMILENGADTSLRDDEGATCLHLASRGGHKDVIKVFVDKRMNINEKGEHDRTPLLYASRYGHSDLVEFLLVHGGDTNLTCAGDNSLHLACVAGNLDSVKILVNHGMDISLEGQQKKTPLMYACRRGHLDVVNFLIEKGAKFDLLDINEGTCLHLAANAGNIDLVKRLIDLGLHADAANKRGRTPVSIAIFQGHLELVKFLFNYCFSQCDKVSELFPLYLPCITGDVEMTNLLLSFKVDINRTGPLKRSPLMRACLNGHTDIINILIKAGADTSAVDEHGSRCIHLACQVGSINSVRILLDSGCDINSRGQNNWTPVMYACRYSNLDLFNLLFEREADTSLVDAKNANSIHLLCKGKDDNAEILTKLVNLGVDFEALDSFHKSPLLYASSKGHINCFELLCRKKADLKLTDLKGTNALHFACQGGHVDIVQQLLALEFDINGRGHQGLTPLMQACHSKAGNLELIEVLLEKGADLYAFDDYGANCLNRACQGGNVKIVQKLLDLKLNLTNQGQNKWTPVMCASRFGHRDVIDVLLNYINKDSLTLRDVNGASCLHLACQGGHVDVIARLLDLGLDINGLGQHQRTPAMYACRSGNTDVLKLLSEKGANTEITDKFRANCLHLSCMGNWDNIDTVKKLVEMAFDVNSTDVYGRTAIMYACKHGHSETFEFLLSKGADVTMRDLRGVSCYKFASNGGHQDLVNRLREVMGT